MRALSLAHRPEEAEVPSPGQHGGRSGGGPYAPVTAPETAAGASTPHAAPGLGATGAVTTGIGGYTNVPAASTDAHRPAASRYRA
jgi:hypothetical protein